MAEIATIHGGSVPGEPSEDITETIEGLLAQARSEGMIGLTVTEPAMPHLIPIVTRPAEVRSHP